MTEANSAVKAGSADQQKADQKNAVDVIVIGLGPGGESVASQCAEAGLSVVGIESRLVGGECPYYGCIPSKMMIRGANALAESRRVGELAGDSEQRPDWSPIAQRIRDEATDDWNDQVAVDRLVDGGARFVRGRARLTGPNTVVVDGPDGDGQVFEASKAIVINAGTEPAVPPIEGLAETPYWTNREAVAVTEVPTSVTVLGGGAIGLELAQTFARFGAKVTVVEAADRLMMMDEPEAAELIARVLRDEGLDVRTGAKVTAVRHDDAGFTLSVGDDTIQTEQLLVATGRRTELEALGVAALGLDVEQRFLPTDERMRVTDKVWAIGDITGKGAFTHISMYQASIAARDILGADGQAAEYHAVPRVTFTDPEVGAVGLTEAQAREQGLNVRTGTAQVPSSARGWIHKAGNDGLIKLVEDADRGVLVGATSAGPHGGEVLSALSVAVHAAVPTQRLREMIYAYPTFHRGIEDALRDLGA